MEGTKDLVKENVKFKISVLGSESVGKSSLIFKYINYNIPSDHDATIEDKYTTVVQLKEVVCEIEILDTGGNAQYQNMLENWINFADSIMLVFSLNDRESFKRLITIREKIAKKIPIVIVGNKSDLIDQRVVFQYEVAELAKVWGAEYIETSAEVTSSII